MMVHTFTGVNQVILFYIRYIPMRTPYIIVVAMCILVKVSFIICLSLIRSHSNYMAA